MATTNLGMEIVPTSDFVSPEPFNRNFEKIDALGVDYIVEKGTSGEWWYRKWKSGRAECGIDNKQFGQYKLTKQSYGLAITDTMSFGAYPFSFKSRPFTIISFQGDKLSSTRGSFIAQRHSESTSQSPYFFVCDWSENNIQPMCGIYVCGQLS